MGKVTDESGQGDQHDGRGHGVHWQLGTGRQSEGRRRRDEPFPLTVGTTLSYCPDIGALFVAPTY